jgi:F-type H+-transporting ATPase subunit gamma
MANTRDIRRRIKSVKGTAQITKAMQLVAASKMKRAQNAALMGRPYASLLAEILASLGDQVVDFRHPFLEERPVRHRGILLVTSDKGLCGALVSNLLRQVVEIKEPARYVAIGRKGSQFLSRTQRDMLADFSVSDQVRFAEVRPAMEFMINEFVEKQSIDTIEIIFPRFVNTLVQESRLVKILPITDLAAMVNRQLKEAGLSGLVEDQREIQFEPGPEIILGELLHLYIKQEVYQRVLEAKASEHSARMVAMKTATDNAGNLVDDLTLVYNKARQASITQEILEISAAQIAQAG